MIKILANDQRKCSSSSRILLLEKKLFGKPNSCDVYMYDMRKKTSQDCVS